ncbi:PEP/pyruvate-binding domain-containing protein [Propionimicrobium lymphophilum]|uniref:PEP/pyruvate-binding domain-containing protein n=1 Tax=Propionimicrobium lymphophilum TaxID=33012 RepID=UPI0023EFA6DD|nr:PEP/pyruvate-binding domain-containing protein [Propionimicrobium lymphophilum]
MSYERLSTGFAGLDHVLGRFLPGDNVVWQYSDFSEYLALVRAFAGAALDDGVEVSYVRFGSNPVLLDSEVRVFELEANNFESFTSQINRLLLGNGTGGAYVFDPLSELKSSWLSDLSIANFFHVTSQRLFELNAVSAFGLEKSAHTNPALNKILDSAQVVCDVFGFGDECRINPLKLWLRKTPGPVNLAGEAVETPTVVDPAGLDGWNSLIEESKRLLAAGETGEANRDLLIETTMGSEGDLVELAKHNMTLGDAVKIAEREIGSGPIGGKSVGVLVARSILEHTGHFEGKMEAHDSYFLGSDLFFEYIIANDLWQLWSEQKTPTSYFPVGAQLNAALKNGTFPPSVRAKFSQMLEYFDGAPIIVRSSSLLEDNFGNAFAGKYESVFCTNQGSRESQLKELEDAIRTVYASVMGDEALVYRLNRGLDQSPEQMSILVQRVSGARHGDLFFPHAAGVGNSSNIYVWDATLDPQAGLMRLVFGLGTRAVDRTLSDYPKLVALDKPELPVDVRDPSSHSQRYVDVLDLQNSKLSTIALNTLIDTPIDADWRLFASVDHPTVMRLRHAGRKLNQTPKVLDFNGLLEGTDFAETIREMLATLANAYDYPVDTEFTVNIDAEGVPLINLVQCRPLQTKGLGSRVQMPKDPKDVLIKQRGNFMGGNVRMPIEYAVIVRPEAYLQLSTQQRYSVARGIGRLNRALSDTSFMIAGPGRWGTTTPSLGVPSHFTELNNAGVLAEFTYPKGNFRPELSQGSHFFQEIVEQGMFYLALFTESRDVVFDIEKITDLPNHLVDVEPGLASLADVLHVAKLDGQVLYSDIATQQVICCS